MLRAIGTIIASVSVLLITFVVLVSAQNITKDISSGWNGTDSQNGTMTVEANPSEQLRVYHLRKEVLLQ